MLHSVDRSGIHDASWAPASPRKTAREDQTDSPKSSHWHQEVSSLVPRTHPMSRWSKEAMREYVDELHVPSGNGEAASWERQRSNRCETDL
jgi:hypothetical protein